MLDDYEGWSIEGPSGKRSLLTPRVCTFGYFGPKVYPCKVVDP